MKRATRFDMTMFTTCGGRAGLLGRLLPLVFYQKRRMGFACAILCFDHRYCKLDLIAVQVADLFQLGYPIVWTLKTP